MPLSPGELRRQLSAIEPTEDIYEGLTPEDVPALRELLDDDEAWMAGRAVYALARLDSPDASAALREAARSPRDVVRVAVAANAPLLTTELADGLLRLLLDDGAVAVRKFAVKGVSARNSLDVQARVAELAAEEADPTLREIAVEVSSSLSS